MLHAIFFLFVCFCPLVLLFCLSRNSLFSPLASSLSPPLFSVSCWKHLAYRPHSALQKLVDRGKQVSSIRVICLIHQCARRATLKQHHDLQQCFTACRVRASTTQQNSYFCNTHHLFAPGSGLVSAPSSNKKLKKTPLPSLSLPSSVFPLYSCLFLFCFVFECFISSTPSVHHTTPICLHRSFYILHTPSSSVPTSQSSEWIFFSCRLVMERWR